MLFPVARSVARLVDLGPAGVKSTENSGNSTVFDVAFYPYLKPDQDAIFAAVAANEVFICRPTLDAQHPIQVLRVFRDARSDIVLNSVAWSQDIETGDPLVCFAGAGSGKIQIGNVRTGDVSRILNGHGASVNELIVSPLSPQILASGSVDRSIRIWNLDPKYQKHSCAAILGGDGHKGALLAMAFHPEGRYLISGGDDTVIALWAVPRVPDENAGTDKTTLVHYPLFASNEIHPDYVDCLKFYGDLILSHATTSAIQAKENNILLWRIEGFNSLDPIPDTAPYPEPGKYTRSAFGRRFQRLLTFDMPNTMPFYLRFSLFDTAGHRPILVMGDTGSRFLFWDLQALEEGSLEHEIKRSKQKTERGRSRQSMPSLGRSADPGTSRTSMSGSTVNTDGQDNGVGGTSDAESDSRDESEQPKRLIDPRRDLADPFRPLPPHHILTAPGYSFTTRQIAWSNCGKWCVAVGELGLIWVFRRERTV